MKAYYKTIFIFILCSLFLVNLHNVISFPPTRGLDATAHIEFIEYLKTYKHLPAPYEGWELYQAPLYYLIAVLFPNIKTVQFFGIISWVLIIFSVYKLLSNDKKEDELALLSSVLLAAALPVLIYQVPAVGNELFSAAMISLCIMLYLRKPNGKLWGIFLGLSLLSKATAIILIPVIVFDKLISTKFDIKKSTEQLNFNLLIAGLIGGWFYLKNLVKYKNPLITSVDFPAWESFGQQVIPRNFYFFSTMRGFINFDFFHSQNYSFLSGTYFSFFYDAHNIIIPPQELPTLGVIIFLLSIPIFIISIYGFFLSFAKIITRQSLLRIELFCILHPTFLIFSYIAYNFRHPYYSTVKGSFITSLTLPVAYFFYQTQKRLPRKIQILSFALVAIFSIIVMKHFWVEEWWY